MDSTNIRCDGVHSLPTRMLASQVPTLVGDFLGGSKTVKTIRSPRVGSIQGLAMATDVAPGHPGWDVLKVLVEEEGTGNR